MGRASSPGVPGSERKGAHRLRSHPTGGLRRTSQENQTNRLLKHTPNLLPIPKGSIRMSSDQSVTYVSGCTTSPLLSTRARSTACSAAGGGQAGPRVLRGTIHSSKAGQVCRRASAQSRRNRDEPSILVIVAERRRLRPTLSPARGGEPRKSPGKLRGFYPASSPAAGGIPSSIEVTSAAPA